MDREWDTPPPSRTRICARFPRSEGNDRDNAVPRNPTQPRDATFRREVSGDDAANVEHLDISASGRANYEGGRAVAPDNASNLTVKQMNRTNVQYSTTFLQ